MRKVTLSIEGMSCGHCLNAVNKELGRLVGVRIDSVAIGRAAVAYDEALTDPAQIAEALTTAGYRTASAAPTELLA